MQRAPERMCVVCRKRWSRQHLVRVVRTESGLVIDRLGKLDGRGAYVCSDEACWKRDDAAPKIGHALKSRLGNPERVSLRLDLERYFDSKASANGQSEKEAPSSG